MHLSTTPLDDIKIANSSGTSANVQITVNGASAADTKVLFDQDVTAAPLAGGLAGFERKIILSATDVTEGSEVVVFDILSGSM